MSVNKLSVGLWWSGGRVSVNKLSVIVSVIKLWYGGGLCECK